MMTETQTTQYYVVFQESHSLVCFSLKVTQLEGQSISCFTVSSQDLLNVSDKIFLS